MPALDNWRAPCLCRRINRITASRSCRLLAYLYASQLPFGEKSERIWRTSVQDRQLWHCLQWQSRQSRSCRFPFASTDSSLFYHLSLDTSSLRHLATNQTGILQSAISHSLSHRASNLAFATRGHQPGACPNHISWTYCKLLRGPLLVLA